MSLLVIISAHTAKEDVMGLYDPDQNRVRITGFRFGHRIIDEVRRQIRATFPGIESANNITDKDWETLAIESMAAEPTLTDGWYQICSRFKPIFTLLEIEAGHIEGVRTGYEQFRIFIGRTGQWVWGDTAERIAVGTGPYRL